MQRWPSKTHVRSARGSSPDWGSVVQLKAFAPDQDILEHSVARETQATGVA